MNSFNLLELFVDSPDLFIAASFTRTPGTNDDDYLVPVDGGFEMYRQERGGKYESRIFKTEAEAVAAAEAEYQTSLATDERAIQELVDNRFRMFGVRT